MTADRASREPPDSPPGWRTGPPDFVGVGAQRSGTTWWFWLLRDHPQVTAGAKERHFFDRFWSDEFGPHEIAAYHRHFPRPDGSITGEWTPRYMHDFWVPPLLARAAPQARLLVMLRDPVERYRSGVSKMLLSDDPPHPKTAIGAAMSRGLYATQLRRLLASFPREQLLVLQYERCRDDPLSELRRTYEFLGLEAGFVPESLDARPQETAGAKQAIPATVVDALRAVYEPEIRELVRDFPEVDPALWR